MSKETSSLKTEDITKRLDAIIAILMDQDKIKEYNQTKKIAYLTDLKFNNPDIAKILGTSLKSVEAQKYKKKETAI